MQALRYCIVKGHETNIPKLICIAKDCNQQSRRVCEQCGIKLFHLHGYQTQDHLLEKQELIELLNSKQLDLPLKELQNIMNKIKEIQQQLVENLQIQSQSNIIQILEHDFYSVDNDQIQQIIDTIYQDGQSIKNKLLDYIKQMKDQVKLMEETLLKYQVQQTQQSRMITLQKKQTESQEDGKKQQQNNNQQTQEQLKNDKQTQNQQSQDQQIKEQSQYKQMNEQQTQSKNLQTLEQQLIGERKKILEQKDQQKQPQTNLPQLNSSQLNSPQTNQESVKTKQAPFSQYLQLKFDWSIKTAQISKEGKYLACGGDGKIVILYDLKQKQQLKNPLNLDKQISVCQFGNDSNLLYIGTYDGFIYCFDIYNNLEMIYSYQILKKPIVPISNLIEIDYKVIIASSFGDICKIQIKNGQQFQQKLHNSRVFALEYKNDVLISGSADLSIKFINCSNLSILFEKQHAHTQEITYIQMISKDQFMSLDFGHILKIWSVDYTQKQINYIRQLTNLDSILNFRCINANHMLLICENMIKIKVGNDEQVQMYDSKDQKAIFCVSQLNQVNYIIIPEEKQITVMRDQFAI